MTNSLMSERWALLAQAIGTASSTPLVSNYVSTGKSCRKLLAILQTVTIADAETLDFRFVKASDAAGTGKATLKGATQRAAHATANDGIQIMINLDENEHDAAKPFIGLEAVTSGATGGVVAMQMFGADFKYRPFTDIDLATIVEQKS